ncbi:uncharacterized protein CEXT_251121 [Caerostris extrusa]|uniref:F-box/LRR-repeat protein n=1 Tax=Caerostris extrusa TaxID=172846 RepID=A0AAV4TU70_CAEEX|nr:uncharacterized protein CEXT_251121 [Caerostris extrusa]
MPAPSLYKQCQKQIIRHLIAAWRIRCTENPFQILPSDVFQELVDYTLSLPCYELPEASKLSLLLVNYLLKRLDLSCFAVTLRSLEDRERQINARETCSSLISMLSSYTFPNLRSLHLPVDLVDMSAELGNLIRGCANLETLHTATCFDLSNIENCRRLRVARIHSSASHVYDFLQQRAYSLMNLEALEIFSACDPDPCFTSYEAVANILISCRNIISLGLVDSSMAIDHVLNDKDSPFAFRLQRCFWGYGYNSYLNRSKKSVNYKLKSTILIRNAACACPLVEELVMQVFQKESLQPLNLLNRLTFLSLSFSQCDDNYLPEFISLISEIGHRIKHLSVEGSLQFPVNDICSLCVNLESLKINGHACVKYPVESFPSLHNLKRFIASEIDQKCFQFVLSNCPNITELFLGSVPYLNDLELKSILKTNSLANLEILTLTTCSLTENGLSKLIKSAFKLKKFVLEFFKEPLVSVIKELNRDINYSDYPQDFFDYKLNRCTF